MTDLNRIKQLAGLTESARTQSEMDPPSTVQDRMAASAHHWVNHDIDLNAMKAATWAILMNFDSQQLSMLHTEFHQEQAADRGDEEDY